MFRQPFLKIGRVAYTRRWILTISYSLPWNDFWNVFSLLLWFILRFEQWFVEIWKSQEWERFLFLLYAGDDQKLGEILPGKYPGTLVGAFNIIWIGHCWKSPSHSMPNFNVVYIAGLSFELCRLNRLQICIVAKTRSLFMGKALLLTVQRRGGHDLSHGVGIS